MTLAPVRMRRGHHDDLVVLASHSAKLAGAEIAMARVATALTRYRPHVFLGEDGPIADMLRRDGVPVEIMPMDEELRSLTRDDWLHWRFLGGSRAATSYIAHGRDRLAELRPLLVHTNSLKSGFLSGSAARLAGIPQVWHLRDHLSRAYLSRGSLAASWSLIRASATIAVANSLSTRATLPRGIPSCVIPSPIGGLPPWRPGVVVAGPRTLTFTVLGRLAPWKGQDLFLRAFARAFPDGSHRALLVGGALFGEDAYAAELRDLVDRLGIADRVTLTGHVEDPQTHLADTDVLVHTSVIPEPFGLVIVEGMAAGLPVVAADEGGPRETVTPGIDGLLYRMGDEVALAAQLRGLAADPDKRARLGAQARETSRQYIPEAIAARVEHVYDCVAAGRGKHPRHVTINGRFLSRPVSGVERFARNISTRLDTPSRVLVPPRSFAGHAALGHLWEQTVLPLRVPKQSLLWNPCNFGPLLARRSVVTVHDLAPIDHPEWFGDRYRRLFAALAPRLCNRAVAVTTVSSFTRDRLADRLGIDPATVTVVTNGCDVGRTLRPAEDQPIPEPYVLAIGAADPRKNLTGVRLAMAMVRETNPGLMLRVTGGRTFGVFAASIPESSSLDVFTGHVTDDELVALYRGARCLVYASFYEGFGLPPLEAMAMGTRVVASRLPSIEEVCGDAAIYVDPGDPADIARGIERALSEPADERRSALAEGRARCARYSWSASAHRLDELFAEIWGM